MQPRPPNGGRRKISPKIPSDRFIKTRRRGTMRAIVVRNTASPNCQVFSFESPRCWSGGNCRANANPRLVVDFLPPTVSTALLLNETGALGVEYAASWKTWFLV